MARKIDPNNRLININKFFDSIDELLNVTDIENITIKDICKQANLSIGLFYYYFENKEHVFYQKFTQINNRCKIHLDPLLTFTNINKDVNNYIDFYITTCTNRGYKYFAELYKFLITSSNINTNNKDREIYQYLNLIIEAGQKNGEISIEYECDELCNLFLNSLRGFVFKWISSQGTSDLKSDIYNYTKIFLNGISIKKTTQV